MNESKQAYGRRLLWRQYYDTSIVFMYLRAVMCGSNQRTLAMFVRVVALHYQRPTTGVDNRVSINTYV